MLCVAVQIVSWLKFSNQFEFFSLLCVNIYIHYYTYNLEQRKIKIKLLAKASWMILVSTNCSFPIWTLTRTSRRGMLLGGERNGQNTWQVGKNELRE